MSWAGAGAGAADGLEEFLTRELAQRKFEQTQKEHTDDVALKSRQLDQSGANQKSEAELRALQTQKILDDRKEAERQRGLRDGLKTTATTQQERDFIAADDAGVKMPFQLIQQPNGAPRPTPPAGPVEDTPNGLVRVGPDNKATPLVDGDGKPLTRFHPPQQGTVIQGPEGFFRAVGTDAKPITAGGAQVESKPSAQVAQRQDMATRVGSHFSDLSSELDDAEKQGLLGPLAGRTVSDFLGGQIGTTGDEKKDELLGQLRMDLSGVVTGFSSLHGRGGANAGIAQKLALDSFNAKKMSHAELKGGIDALKKWVDGYAAPSSSHGAAAAPVEAPTKERTYNPATGKLE